MSTSESSGWRKSWVVGVIALAAIAFGVSRIHTNLRRPPETDEGINRIALAMAADPTSFALAEHAAAEAGRLLGAGGGAVALVIPAAEALLNYSYGGAYVAGFQAGLQRQANVKLEGIYYAAPPHVGNRHEDQRAPTFDRLQDVRQTHPQAKVIISFLGLPQFTPEEQVAWLQSNPPKMIVVDPWAAVNREVARQALNTGLINALVINTKPVAAPEDLVPEEGAPAPVAMPSLFETLRRP
jgi:hypothetical protein